MALPPPSTPIPSPIAPLLPPPGIPIPAPITPDAIFQQRLSAFNAAAVKALADEADKYKTVARAGTAALGSKFRWELIGQSMYSKIVATVPGMATVKANVEKMQADVAKYAAKVDLTTDKKLEMIDFYEKQLKTQQDVLAKIEPAAQAKINALVASAQAHYTPIPSNEDVFEWLKVDVPKYLVNVGTRRSDYRSKFDTAESNTFGASYNLVNTPFVVHIHAAGSGTILSALSVKKGASETGKSVIPNGWFKGEPTLDEALRDRIARAPENPRTIALDRRDNIQAPGRSW